ncbi:MAG: hypothetical protein K6E29_05135 [Cyanobacteria bacterium RUI128]|nr:hypothetical protein [Cyanobacteria bacterium RUI128]
MSITKISTSDRMADLKNRILLSTGVGAVAGGIYSAIRPNWLYKGLPSDTFVKETSREIRKTMNSEDLKESAKISKFLKAAIDPETNVEELRPQILDSKELSEAIKASHEETVEDAIKRVYSQPKDKVRQDLIDIQFKTKADKISGRTTVLKMLNDNFDASKKTLVKHSETSDNMFALIKKTAGKIQAKAIAKGAAIAGCAAGALCLILSDVPED